MLKLIYHTAVFGPLDFEYDRPLIRVGSSEDNDLVLRHPSVQPHHCLLLFRDEKVLRLPPGQQLPSAADLPDLTGPEFGPGDLLQFGDLQFSLAHSSRTVAIHQALSQYPATGASEGGPTIGPETRPGQPRYYCPNCRAFIQEAAVKRVGLVGHAKRNLCPKCSHLLESKPASVAKAV